MKDAIIGSVTNAPGRKSLYHFTRARNLPAVAHYDALKSSYGLDPHFAGERRSKARELKLGSHSITINAHLKIPDSMIDPSSTQEQFRASIDRHVFFWPTLRDCRKMLDTYARREPDEDFAILVFDARSLLSEHYDSVKLSKYDSGSSPRYPNKCSYRKSPEMHLPLNSFKSLASNLVPVTASEIREVLIENGAYHLSKHLRGVYADNVQLIPDRWKDLAKPLALLE